MRSSYGRDNIPIELLADHILSISESDENGCILSPYPPFDYKKLPYSRLRVNNRMVLLHRFIYEHKNGSIPTGRLVMHSCDNPRCINPSHLVAGTYRDNVIDRHNKGRANSAVGTRNFNARFVDSDIPKIIDAVDQGESMASVARRLGVSTAAISAIYNKKTWKHIP